MVPAVKSKEAGCLNQSIKQLLIPAMPPSWYQVRFQGCKGVLSRYSLLQGRHLQLRPSMEKFGSDHPKLEVCSVAAWLPAYLNRQVILMMNYNGVPPKVRLIGGVVS